MTLRSHDRAVLSEDEVRRMAREWTSAELSDRAGVTIAYVDMVKAGTRKPGPKILAALGLEKVIAKRACNVKVGMP